MAMRKLWEDHMNYTHEYIVSVLAGLKDAPDVLDRLNKNQDDIGQAIQPFYGDDAAKKLATLLHTHIAIAGDMVKAVKDKNQKEIDDAKTKAYGNADDIAAFLSGANTNWSKDDLSAMLHTHIDFLASQASAREKKDWKSDIDAFDQGTDHMMKFSDALIDGI